MTTFKSLIAAAVFSLLALPAYAQSLDDLVALLSFQQYSADFKQQSFDQKKQLLQSLDGKLILQKPNQFFWQSQAPYAQELVGNGKTIWHYDEDLAQVVVQDYQKQMSNAPILLILKDTDSLKQRFKLNEVKTINGVQQFTLSPIAADKSSEIVQLSFQQGLLVGLYFLDNLGQSTQVTFSQVQINQPVKADVFEFVIPKDADVVYE